MQAGAHYLSIKFTPFTMAIFHPGDDKLLESKWYISMVLVNGARGIGTGKHHYYNHP